MRKIPSSLLLTVLALGAFTACGGGGGGSSSSDGPGYTAPQATGWSLQKNSRLSHGRHLVLDLVGPAGGQGLGVALNLGLDSAKAIWVPATPSDPSLVENMAFNLGSGTLAFKAVASEGVLRLGVFSKGIPAAYTGPLVRVALDLDGSLPPGASVRVECLRANELTAAGVRPVSVAIGPIVAQ